MAEKRKSIYAGPPVEKLLKLYGSENISGLINGCIEKYLQLMEDSLPGLDRDEWLLICDSRNGSIPEQGMTGAILAMGIHDSIRLDALDDKWSVNGAALLAKLELLDAAQTAAVQHVVQVFWNNLGKDYDEVFEMAGLNLKKKMPYGRWKYLMNIYINRVDDFSAAYSAGLKRYWNGCSPEQDKEFRTKLTGELLRGYELGFNGEEAATTSKRI